MLFLRCTLISNHAKALAVGNKFHVTCHRYRNYKEKVNLKIKYEDGSDDMDGIATTTVKQTVTEPTDRDEGAYWS
jgi:hypothetical protein